MNTNLNNRRVMTRWLRVIVCMLIALVMVIQLIPLTKVLASSTATTNQYIYSGSIKCGTLVGWGSWRYTDNVTTPRTIYFEPARVGTHKIQFYTYRLNVDPYWSNDGGKTWNRWYWSDGNYFAGNAIIDVFATKDLKTDKNTTIYKFVFSSATPQYIKYHFYCGR